MMNRKRIGLCYGGLLLALIALLLWNSCAGSSETSLGSVMRILLGDAADETMYHIVWRIRLPRILASVVLGGALSPASCCRPFLQILSPAHLCWESPPVPS